jgi:hypothetical protein
MMAEKENEIYDAYNSFTTAKKRNCHSGKLFSSRRMNTALKKAAKNKVKIKLILAGISDVTLQTRNPSYLRYFWTITLSYMNGTKPFCMEKQQLLTAIGPLSVLST